VCVASPGMLEALHARMPQLPLHLITNAYDPEDFKEPLPARQEGTFQLLFVGTFDARLTPPDPLLEGVSRARQIAPHLRLRVLGGADLESERALARYPELVERGGFVPHRRAITEMRAADALVLSVAPGASWHLTAKVIEYLATGRPILALVPPGDCRDLLERAGGAVVVDPTDHQGIARALVDAAKQGELRVPTRRASVIETFSARRIAESTAQIVQGLVRASSR
jgi:glycosyltransferase involved in cell wall biosynthesis